MPYKITCAKFKYFEDDFQHLALGLVDGAVVVLDLVLGLEKYFLEKHPAAISALAFYEDKVVVSGSIDGRVNVSDLFNMDEKRGGKLKNLKFLKC